MPFPDTQKLKNIIRRYEQYGRRGHYQQFFHLPLVLHCFGHYIKYEDKFAQLKEKTFDTEH